MLTFGLGMFLGSQLAGFIGGRYVTQVGHAWPQVWLWPAGLALAVCLMFLAAGREPSPRESEQ